MSQFIDLRHDKRRILLPVKILPPRPIADLSGVDAIALLDTGSTTSGITRTIVESLGLTGRGKKPIGTVQGEGQAERYLFRVGLQASAQPSGVPSFPFIFDDIIGFELGASFQFGALLGMDILSQCSLTMRPDGACRLGFG